MIGAKVSGVGEVAAKLAKVKNAIRNKITRKAVNEGAGVMLRAEKATAPVDTGALRMSLGRLTKVYRNSGVVVGMAGPRSGFKRSRIGGKRTRVQTSLGRKLAALGKAPTRTAHLAEKKTKFASRAMASSEAAATEAVRSRIASEVEAL